VERSTQNGTENEKGQVTVKHARRLMSVVALALALFVVMGASTPAAAQPASQQRVLDKVSFGYKFYRVSFSDFSENYPLGFYVDASGDLGALPGWDWIGEVTFAFKSETDEDDFDIDQRIMFLGGGVKREFTNNPSIIPHVQVLVGLANAKFSASFDGDEVFEDSQTDFAIKISGGIDKPINDRWDVRAGAGYILVFTEDEKTSIFRLFFGAVYRLG
jgi:hypothetical protein